MASRQTGAAEQTPPEFPERRFVIGPLDYKHGYRVGRLVYYTLKAAISWGRKWGMAIEVVIRLYLPGRSDEQRRTMWMWHGQVASELTIRTGQRWTKDDVHEVIFLERWMPKKELLIPDTGEIVMRPVRTSGKPPPDDPRSMREIISEAMEQYIVWCVEQAIDITVPESKTW